MGFGLGLRIPVLSDEARRVIGEVDTYLAGDLHRRWYAGIATNAEQRLFADHNVDKLKGQWIYLPCSSDSVAREVEQYFLGQGCQGGGSGGDTSTRFVYAYLVTWSTRQ